MMLLKDDMKEYYFDQIPSKEDVIKKIAYENSLDNKNEIKRPKIKFKDYLTLLSFPSMLIVSLSICLLGNNIHRIIMLIIFIIYLLFIIKMFSLVLIRFYQAFAPINIRLKCCFVPSCSEYTYISISRYGVIKGVFKGLMRIKRCNPQNGGIENP